MPVPKVIFLARLAHHFQTTERTLRMQSKGSTASGTVKTADKIFPGIWRNTWTHGDETDYEIFEIRNKNEYHILKKQKVNGRYAHDQHRFYIEILENSEEAVSFTKIWVGEDKPPIINKNMKRTGANRIEGMESDSAKVVYTREE
jgi:hypothetical protein